MPVRVRVEGKAVDYLARGTSIVYRKWVKPRHSIPPGALVELESARSEPLGCGLWEPVGPVAVRVLKRGACPWSDPVEALEYLLGKAYEARGRYRARLGSSYRLVNSDGDRLSGLIVDVFAEELAVLQSSSLAIDSLAEHIASIVARLTGVEAVYEKSLQRSRRDIGLEPRSRWLLGRKPRVIVEEGPARFIVDVVRGQKTGFYLDQRLNRLEFHELAYEGSRVLDVFSYTGGFGIHASLAGAREVVFLEEDPNAVALLRENLRLNRVENYRIINESIWRAEGVPQGYFDLLAVDPPAFIQSGSREAVERGFRAYKRAYSWSLEKARDGAIAYLSSCSYFLTRELFLEAIASSAGSAGVEYRIMGSLRGAGPDHALRGEEYLDYLKGAFLHVYKP